MSKILFVSNMLKAPSFRLRIKPLISFLEENGIKSNVLDFDKKIEILRVFVNLRFFKKNDLIFFQKLKLLNIERMILKKFCRNFVFDFDDAIMFGKPKKLKNEPDMAKWRQKRFSKMLSFCNFSVAGSKSLRKIGLKFGKKIRVLYTPVDIKKYPLSKQEGEIIKICWIGLGKNIGYLEDLKDVFLRLKKERKFVLTVISNKLPDLKDVPMEFIEWSEEKEGEEISKCHIGISPMPDNLWTKGKGGYKIIQYFASGLPAIGSPVGANLEIIEHGKNGFLAKNEEEWLENLIFLIDNKEKRKFFGKNGREKVERFFNLDFYCKTYFKWLSEYI